MPVLFLDPGCHLLTVYLYNVLCCVLSTQICSRHSAALLKWSGMLATEPKPAVTAALPESENVLVRGFDTDWEIAVARATSQIIFEPFSSQYSFGLTRLGTR